MVVEKIQGGKERIPDDWAVHGTTGYRFANLTTGLLIDASAGREFTDIYEKFIGHPLSFEALLVEKKKQVMAVSMSSEINGLARELNRISEMNRRTRDFTLNSIRRALIGFIAHFPVYRTYVSPPPGRRRARRALHPVDHRPGAAGGPHHQRLAVPAGSRTCCSSGTRSTSRSPSARSCCASP